MGRGVEVRSDSLLTVYADWTGDFEEWYADWVQDQEDEGNGPYDLHATAERIFYSEVEPENWQCDLDWFKDRVQELWPSFQEGDGWLGWPYSETRIVLSNSLVEIGVSEYAGMTALTIAPVEDEYGNKVHPGLAAQWVRQIEERFVKEFSDYNRVGTFSNGESVYERSTND